MMLNDMFFRLAKSWYTLYIFFLFYLGGFISIPKSSPMFC